MKIIADIGNSQIKIATAENQQINKVNTFLLKDISLVEKYFIKICKKEKCSLFYSSVLGTDFEREFRSTVKNIFRKIIRFKSSQSFLSVKNSYSAPSKLGSDRWAQIIGAYKIYKDDVMIVSCGSAVSVDHVTSKGVHKGGLLLSGADRYIKCFSDIHNLKGIKLSQPKRLKSNTLKNSTIDQIAMGYKLMLTSSINKIYSDLNTKSKKKVLLILSGSYAENIPDIIATKKIIEPYFVLKSLALIENYM